MLNTDNSKYYVSSNPKQIIVDTTNICNLQCKMCHQNSPDFVIGDEPHISLEMINDISMIASEAISIYLIGAGEPLMHPDIYEIIKIFKKNCSKATVGTTSNGVLLNEKNILKLIESGLDNISISMDGPNLERGHQKSERTRKNLIRLNEKKIEMGINHPNIYIGFVLGNDNKHELIPMIEFAHSINCAGITVEPLRIIAPQEDWDDYIIKNDPLKHMNKIEPILKLAKELTLKYKLIFNTPYLPMN